VVVDTAIRDLDLVDLADVVADRFTMCPRGPGEL
jgi:hypothetical protein